MKYAPATILFVAVASVKSVLSASITCGINHNDHAPNWERDNLLDCLEKYGGWDYLTNWDGMVCKDYEWFKGGRAWNSPKDCYNACKPCLTDGAKMNLDHVQCDATAVLAGCWMGYRREQN